jgi:hypothetical protein
LRILQSDAAIDQVILAERFFSLRRVAKSINFVYPFPSLLNAVVEMRVFVRMENFRDKFKCGGRKLIGEKNLAIVRKMREFGAP